MFKEIICNHCKEKILVTKDKIDKEQYIKEYEEKLINYLCDSDNFMNSDNDYSQDIEFFADNLKYMIKNGYFR